ncbi:hypothetical protein F2P81_004204 [Scophthalmus maximus]|uniref:Uncharacterized protein n=1 Tax=Scophthalmus maximus TaxID=52904 RepID=A0A6A4T935_SCOMX|nr:hypothetical protein F2P81_004204 [Scophthalmus maximus]
MSSGLVVKSQHETKQHKGEKEKVFDKRRITSDASRRRGASHGEKNLRKGLNLESDAIYLTRPSIVHQYDMLVNRHRSGALGPRHRSCVRFESVECRVCASFGKKGLSAPLMGNAHVRGAACERRLGCSVSAVMYIHGLDSVYGSVNVNLFSTLQLDSKAQYAIYYIPTNILFEILQKRDLCAAVSDNAASLERCNRGRFGLL